jgi:hypothetical protein
MKIRGQVGCGWVMPIILAEIVRILVPGQPRHIVYQIPCQNSHSKTWTGVTAQVVECLLCYVRRPEFKPQSHQQSKTEQTNKNTKGQKCHVKTY